MSSLKCCVAKSAAQSSNQLRGSQLSGDVSSVLAKYTEDLDEGQDSLPVFRCDSTKVQEPIRTTGNVNILVANCAPDPNPTQTTSQTLKLTVARGFIADHPRSKFQVVQLV